MQQSSRKILSNQTGIHPDLEMIVTKHLHTTFQKPVSEYSHKIFTIADDCYRQYQRNFILDSGCGVGESCYHIARQNPQAFVLGIDQSEHRISSNSDWELPKNVLLLRADIIDFWRLAVDAGWQLSQHFLLYPNPWPKKKHLQRRWHGHAVFPLLKDLGGLLELRTNWQIYGDEFSRAINFLTNQPCKLEPWQPDIAITPFERKYQNSAQQLYRLTFLF